MSTRSSTAASTVHLAPFGRRRRVGVVAAVLGLATSAGVAGVAPAATAAPVPAMTGYAQVNLVSDVRGAARVTDPHLVNAWGLAQGPTTPVWVSDNGANVSTLYTTATPGAPVTALPLVVAVPGGSPTGQVFNPTSHFTLPDRHPAMFVFAGEDGVLSAWNRQLSPSTSAVRVASVPGATFKGITLVTAGSSARLLVADFGRGRIDAFDTRFRPVALPRGAFVDPHLPGGYAPFNVFVTGGRVFVTYAVRNPKTHDDVAGAGHGVIDVYSSGGRLLARFARGGVLNSPWGLAIAPGHFGAFSGSLLVGNFGDGRVHAYDPRSGRLLGTLRRPNGSAVVIDGLWGLLAGNGTSAARSDVWFGAGPGHEAHGLLGVLRAAG